MSAKRKPETSRPESDAPAAARGAEGDFVPVKGVIVTAKREGFRRAGRAWSTTPTRLPAGELTPGQIDLLRAEPMLAVDFEA
jgi:hypothetical protein